MALSKYEIQKRSDEKRGVRPKSYYLSEEVIAQIDELAKSENRPKGAIIADAIAAYLAKGSA